MSARTSLATWRGTRTLASSIEKNVRFSRPPSSALSGGMISPSS